jgi:hypothetical protein
VRHLVGPGDARPRGGLGSCPTTRPPADRVGQDAAPSAIRRSAGPLKVLILQLLTYCALRGSDQSGCRRHPAWLGEWLSLVLNQSALCCGATSVTTVS